MSLIGGLVVPMYNEASRGNLKDRLDLILKWSNDYKVVLVDDCSKDATRIIVRQFIKQNKLDWKLICLKKNCGKGRAIIEGFKYLNTDFIGYMDADLSVSPKYLKDIYEFYDYYTRNCNKNICIVGSRFSSGSFVVRRRTLVRRFVSTCARVLLNSLFNLGVDDVQCGFKFFSKDIVKNNFKRLYPSRWLLDVELLKLTRKGNYHIQHLPVIWCNIENESTLKLHNALYNSFRDMCILLNWQSKLK